MKRLMTSLTLALAITTGGWSGLALAHHGGDDNGETAPPQEVPATSPPPSLQVKWQADNAGGYQLQWQLKPSSLPGHVHLYVNGKLLSMPRATAHIPADVIRPGLNSVTLALANPAHGAYTWQGKPIQTTLLVDTRAVPMVKNRYAWPALP